MTVAQALMMLAVAVGDIGPEAPPGIYVMARENAVCRSVGNKGDPVALVVADTRRVRRPTASATVAELRFKDGGVTRPGDTLETREFDGARTFRPATQMIAVVTSPDCESGQIVISSDARACLMMVLQCHAPDGGVP